MNEKRETELRTALRDLLEEGRRLGITRGPEDDIVRRYMVQVEELFAVPAPKPEPKPAAKPDAPKRKFSTKR